MLRFHKPIVEHFQRLPPGYMIPTTLPKDLKASDKHFAEGRTFAVRRRVGDFNEFGDEFWLLHESGVVLRRLIKRQNVAILLEAHEVSLFPPPKCDEQVRLEHDLFAGSAALIGANLKSNLILTSGPEGRVSKGLQQTRCCDTAGSATSCVAILRDGR